MQEAKKDPMRVLWIAQSCSLQDDKENPGLTGRMEGMMTQYCQGRILLAVAYMADDHHEIKFSQNGITYYAADADLGVSISDTDWTRAKEELLRIIEDFHPDLVQCFGSEWPYGAIAEDVKVPVVIHMMGFLNIYYLSLRFAHGADPVKPSFIGVLKEKLRPFLRRRKQAESMEERCARRERRIMKVNRYFLGRTEWDKNIVRYYAPGARYYKVPEMIKPAVYEAAGQWHYREKEKLRLFSLSSGDDRKGNEIMLRTAQILKEVMNLDFEWRVAGSKDFFPRFEERTGIRHEDVNIELIGMIRAGEIIDEMKTADLFIHPSIMDNSPHAVCEAQLIGTPVIASNVGGVPDLVKDRETGFLYPYNEPHTLAFLIGNLWRDKKILTAISKAASKTALERHDPEKLAGILLRTYESIIEDYHNGRQ